MPYASLFWRVWVNLEGFWDKIPTSASVVESESIAVKQDIHVTCRTWVKKHLTREAIRTVKILILFNLLLRWVKEVLIPAIGSSFHLLHLKTTGFTRTKIFWDPSCNKLWDSERWTLVSGRSIFWLSDLSQWTVSHSENGGEYLPKL